MFRWYEYWLKGVDNGIMDEPAVSVFVEGSREVERALAAGVPLEEVLIAPELAGPAGQALAASAEHAGLMVTELAGAAFGRLSIVGDYMQVFDSETRGTARIREGRLGVWFGGIDLRVETGDETSPSPLVVRAEGQTDGEGWFVGIGVMLTP